jgi:iron complex outermembrane recepter protein
VEVRTPFALTARTTGFFTWLDSPIVNVTIDEGRRQRQNVGAARVFGVELGADWRVARGWTLIGAYTFLDPRIVDGPGALEGKLLAQDPQHRLTGSVQFHEPRLFTAMVQARVLGEQYEDDLNTLLMPAFTVIDASLSRQLVGPLELFVAVENVLNAEYLVGRAGVDTIGQPFSGRVGLRVR